jgi:lincosamide nucleotidyltransferase B/F
MSTTPKLQTIKETIEILTIAARNAPHTIALIGAGSAGVEIARMDQYSDIDFFLVVDEGFSSGFINDNGWIGRELPIVFSFRDTAHGNKVLLENGVFLEFAVFTEAELAQYGIPGLRTIWSKPNFSLPDLSENKPPERDLSYYVDQALSNLLVGALRLRRGERLAALAMVERNALSNLLTAHRVKYNLGIEDPFNIERRAEEALGVQIAPLAQGYEKVEHSLENILNFAERNFEVNASIGRSIRETLNS